jgi:hypothetical protein
MGRARTTGWVIAFVVLILTGTTFAALIENIGGVLYQTDWYYGDGNYFKPNYIGGADDAQINLLGFYTQGQSVPDYWMYYGTFAMEQSSLIEDRTVQNGGRALGVFASGATLTINGDLYRDFGDYDVAATGDLIIADVRLQWELEEQLAPPYPSNTFRGQAFFHITGGALSAPSLNTDGLSLGDFYVEFTFERCSPTVTDFTTSLGDATYTCSAPLIQMGAVPEPVSIVLLGLGGLALIRKRRY